MEAEEVGVGLERGGSSVQGAAKVTATLGLAHRHQALPADALSHRSGADPTKLSPAFCPRAFQTVAISHSTTAIPKRSACRLPAYQSRAISHYVGVVPKWANQNQPSCLIDSPLFQINAASRAGSLPARTRRFASHCPPPLGATPLYQAPWGSHPPTG